MQHAVTTVDDAQICAFARLAMTGIEREYPNKPSDILLGRKDVRPPREVHPAFFGCFDWHSAVHGHWMLVRILKNFPTISVAAEIRSLLARQLTAEKLAVEAAYFEISTNRSFERAYGWAWALRLALELNSWDDPHARDWSKNLQPLTSKLIALIGPYLARLTYPIRTGVHPDTAFALAQTLDYARGTNNGPLEEVVVKYCREKYLHDRDYPSQFEPSGEDFFSPALNEADLVRRVLPSNEFAKWLAAFLPHLTSEQDELPGFLKPVVVSDLSDPKIVHLAGLNLSRAWCLQGIANVLPADHKGRSRLKAAAARHREAGLSYVLSGHYEGEHWLATFAIYLITEIGVH